MTSLASPLLFLLCLASSGCAQLQSLSQDIREELLNAEDIAVVEAREDTGKISSIVSPSSQRCLLVPGELGCTRWVISNCRRLPRTTSRELYHPDCTEVDGRMLRDCQEEASLVPVQNSLVVCGTSVSRQCDGPCFNCPNFCRPQYEETCWTNHKVQKTTRICSASSCTEVEAGLEQVVSGGEEEEELEQVERLEAMSSCSQQKLGEVCAPVNCKFTTEKQECSTQNRTETVRLRTNRCKICQKRKTQIINVEERCEDVLFKDCRERFTVVWKKFCSDYSQSVDRLRRLLNATESRFVFDDHLKSGSPEFDALLDKSLTPVNSLVIETLRKIKIQDLKKDSVVIITPSPAVNDNFLEDKQAGGKSPEGTVNAKYAFEDTDRREEARNGEIDQVTAEPSTTTTTTATTADTSVSGTEVAAAGSSEVIFASSSSANAGSIFSAVLVGSTEGGAVYLGGGAVYYDPALQVLNDRHSEPAGDSATSTVSTTTLTTTETLTTTTTTTESSTTTTTRPTTTTTLRPVGERPMSSKDLLRLCFLNNLGCEFGLNQLGREGAATTQSSTTSTTRATTRTTTASRSSRLKDKTGKDKIASDKLRLCFEYGLCSEEDIEANRQQQTAGVTAASVVAAVTTERAPRSLQAATTTLPASIRDRNADLKARAVACIWRGDC